VPRGRGKVTIEVSRELRDRIRELSQKYGLLYEELLWKALDTLTQSITLSNTQSITQSTTQSKGGAFTQSTTLSNTQSKAKVEEKRHISGGYEWCRSKAKIRNLQNFLKWVDDSFGLIDWWEEDDRVCFETRRKPAKTE
jgi:hypothetical protein